MGIRANSKPERVEFEYEGERGWVTTPTFINRDRMKALEKVGLGLGGGEISIETVYDVLLILLDGMEWDLVDADGQPLPCTKESINRDLSVELAMEIAGQAIEPLLAKARRPEKDKNQVANGAGGSLPRGARRTPRSVPKRTNRSRPVRSDEVQLDGASGDARSGGGGLPAGHGGPGENVPVEVQP